MQSTLQFELYLNILLDYFHVDQLFFLMILNREINNMIKNNSIVWKKHVENITIDYEYFINEEISYFDLYKKIQGSISYPLFKETKILLFFNCCRKRTEEKGSLSFFELCSIKEILFFERLPYLNNILAINLIFINERKEIEHLFLQSNVFGRKKVEKKKIDKNTIFEFVLNQRRMSSLI